MKHLQHHFVHHFFGILNGIQVTGTGTDQGILVTTHQHFVGQGHMGQLAPGDGHQLLIAFLSQLSAGRPLVGDRSVHDWARWVLVPAQSSSSDQDWNLKLLLINC